MPSPPWRCTRSPCSMQDEADRPRPPRAVSSPSSLDDRWPSTASPTRKSKCLPSRPIGPRGRRSLTQLRQRMVNDMTVRGLDESTKNFSPPSPGSRFAAGRCDPARIGPERSPLQVPERLADQAGRAPGRRSAGHRLLACRVHPAPRAQPCRRAAWRSFATLLFKADSRTLLEFDRNARRLDAELGITRVLHA